MGDESDGERASGKRGRERGRNGRRRETIGVKSGAEGRWDVTLFGQAHWCWHPILCILFTVGTW